MEERATEDSGREPVWSDDFFYALGQQRRRVREFLDDHRSTVERIEQELAEQLARVHAALDDERQQAAEGSDEVRRGAAEHETRTRALRELEDRLNAELDAFAAGQSRLHAEQAQLGEDLARRERVVADREATLAAQEAAWGEKQRELAGWCASQELAKSEVEAHRARLAEKEAQVEADRVRLAETLLATRLQRRKIAREFQEQREAQQAFLAAQERALDLSREALEADRQALEISRAELAAEHEGLEAARAQLDQVAEGLLTREDALEARGRECESAAHERSEQLTQALADAQAALETLAMQLQTEREARHELETERQQTQNLSRALEEELHRTRQAHDELVRRLSEAEGSGVSQLVETAGQRDALAARLEEAERQLAEQGARDGGEADDYRRRYELALADHREQKAKIVELEARLQRAASTTGGGGGGGAMDWESQKRRLIEALERDGDSLADEERLSVEEAVRRTEEIVAAKDRELDELRLHLQTQSGNLGELAVGGAAVARILDTDELVVQERENLRQLQEEWRNKLRQTEVELSLERAAIARERATLEERLRVLEDETARHVSTPDESDSKSSAKKPPRGRWLARLGLKEQDEA